MTSKLEDEPLLSKIKKNQSIFLKLFHSLKFGIKKNTLTSDHCG